MTDDTSAVGAVAMHIATATQRALDEASGR